MLTNTETITKKETKWTPNPNETLEKTLRNDNILKNDKNIKKKKKNKKKKKPNNKK